MTVSGFLKLVEEGKTCPNYPMGVIDIPMSLAFPVEMQVDLPVVLRYGLFPALFKKIDNFLNV